MRRPEAALFCIREPVLGCAAELSAPGIQNFEVQGKFPEPCRHIRALLARDFFPSSVSPSVDAGKGLLAMAG